ncbi:MAG: transposase, partial [Candidatus Hydrogenedentes bacterium]|nr:transposase [Candidatus Hydrogenedentota bacterium]
MIYVVGMSRVARIVVPGYPHHVTQRGNRKEDIFLSDADRRAYLRYLHQYAGRHGLALWAYCLMDNHVHLVVVPQREESLARALHGAHTVYAMRLNTATHQSGHVWQGRFYSTPLDDAHLWAAVRYVERNPVRAGLAAHAADYPWSSAQAHCGMASDAVLSKEFPPRSVIVDWADWLRTEDEMEVARIR